MYSKIINLLKDGKFVSVLILSFGFMLIRLGSETTCIIAQTVLNSVKLEDPDFVGNAYICLSIIYGVFAIGSWIAPSVVAVVGAKWTMVFSAIGYVLFIASFIKPVTWILYTTSVICGAGAAILWNAEGNYLTLCSTPKTISRNSGVFWAINQCCYVFGNLLVYFQFSGKVQIDDSTRISTFIALTSSAVIGLASLILLKNLSEKDNAPLNNASKEVDNKSSATKKGFQAFKDICCMFITPPMLLLSITSIYAGIEQSFWNGVFPTAVGNTLAFGPETKRFVGLMGILTGVAGVIGGTLFGLLGHHTTTKIGRSNIVLLGCVCHAACYILVYLNHPEVSIYEETQAVSVINPPSVTAAVVSTMLLGFGDACYQTQLISMFATLYKDNSAPAFAIFKFTESAASAVSFFLSSYLGMLIQTSLMLGAAICGFISYAIVDKKYNLQGEKVSKIPNSTNNNNNKEQETENNIQTVVISL